MIQLQDFYREAKGRYGLRLLTGTAGLTHEFTWVHLCEDIGNVSFLRGGELVITTGLSALREHWLEDFLAALLRRRAAALILNIGKYLRESDIPKELVERAAAAHFPLFLMPWSTHISDIMQDACAQLLEQAQAEKEEERLLALLASPAPLHAGEPAVVVRGEDAALMMKPSGTLDADTAPTVVLSARQKHALDELADRSFTLGRYVLARFSFGGKEVAETEQAPLRLKWRRLLNRLGLRYWLFFEPDSLLLLLELAPRGKDAATPTSTPSLSAANVTPAALLPQLLAAVPPGISADAVHGGVSRPHTALSMLPAAHREAAAACLAAQAVSTPFRAFDDLGPMRLLATHPDRALLSELADEQLGVLRRHDLRHHAQLTETLRAYLQTGGSLQQTAEATFTHRNTVNYRIHKIKELTGCELQDAGERFALLFAYEIASWLSLSSRPRP